jgi:outer membrane biosynthesis protein TonB
VARDGTVLIIETLIRSGVPGFDNNAEGAIRGARLLPLPSDYPDETFDIVIVFWVNERPYDIFG